MDFCNFFQIFFFYHVNSTQVENSGPITSPLEAEVQRLDALGRVLLAETVDEGEGVDLFATSEVSLNSRFMQISW